MKIVLYKKGICRLETNKYTDLDKIREYFKTENTTKFYTQYYVPHSDCDDHIYGISSIGLFKIGLLVSIIQVLKKIDIKYNIDKNVLQSFLPTKYTGIVFNEYRLSCEDEKEHEDRDYQLECVEKLLKIGRGIVVQPTASGKSFIIAKTLYSVIKSNTIIKKCLLLVPNTSLVNQMYKDFLDYGVPELIVSKFSSSKGNTVCKDTNIIITNRQWLNFHEKELPKIDLIFVDETHILKKTSKVSKFVESLDTSFKMGCTATLPDNLADRWNTIGIIGAVLCTNTPIEMQKRDYITKMDITSIYVKDISIDKDKNCLFSLKRKVKSDDITLAYRNEKDYINENIEKLYAYPVNHIIEYTGTGNTLIVFDTIDFGKSLYTLVKSISQDRKTVYYIDGDISVSDRDEIKRNMEKSDNKILIAQTACFSTGENIKNLHNIVLAFNGKSTTKVMQTIGRGLRKHKSKDKMHLYDINFNFKYSKKHLKYRKDIYKKDYALNIDNVVRFIV